MQCKPRKSTDFHLKLHGIVIFPLLTQQQEPLSLLIVTSTSIQRIPDPLHDFGWIKRACRLHVPSEPQCSRLSILICYRSAEKKILEFTGTQRHQHNDTNTTKLTMPNTRQTEQTWHSHNKQNSKLFFTSLRILTISSKIVSPFVQMRWIHLVAHRFAVETISLFPLSVLHGKCYAADFLSDENLLLLMLHCYY